MFVRIFGYLFGMGMLAVIIVAVAVAWYVRDVSKDLPDYEVLNTYEPPVTTRIHASDGALMKEYARQRRLYLPIQAIPQQVKYAFIAAEDKNFYRHTGIDPIGLARAVATNIKNYGTGRRAIGASTITQQVAKNFLLSSERSIDRKIREAILSFRIETAYSKERILELYLNEIYFGLGAYGIAGASLTYFNKTVQDLDLHEMAYLAALPKAPNNYHPYRETEAALTRRNYVIDRMVEDGYVSQKEGEEAKKEDLGVNIRRSADYLFASEYFSEEVRREIIDRYGNDVLYEGGLSVRTTLDPEMQIMARKALQNALLNYDRKLGWRGPVASLDMTANGGDWGVELGEMKPLLDVPEWKMAAVLATSKSEAVIGIRPAKSINGKLDEDRKQGIITLDGMKWAQTFRRPDEGKLRKSSDLSKIFKVGDVIYVEPVDRENESGAYSLRQVPKISGGFVAMDPHTGRVLAMVGGFSFTASEFNRATQAQRQPGSSFKPFIYAAALDNFYTPSSVVMDAPIVIDQGPKLGLWRPKNYGGKYAGPSTLRVGIEKSRNLMTVRLAKDMGMPLVAEYAKRFGIYDNMLPVLAMSLGSGETTVMRMVSAYAVLANGGRQITPSLIDRIQDRYGKTVFKHEERVCATCTATDWHNQDEPVLDDTRDQVLDPMTAYQMTSMLEGVVQNGTAQKVKELEVPVAGKTGTTNEERDAWFIGYTPDLVAGLYIGFDTPRPMGKGNTGGGLAAPVFVDFMKMALAGKKPVEFRVPAGMKLIPINRKTGLRSRAGTPGVIMEAFKPGTAPPNAYSVIGNEGGDFGGDNKPLGNTNISPAANQAVTNGTGGLF